MVKKLIMGLCLLVPGLGIAGLLGPCGAVAGVKETPSRTGQVARVMTRNLYLGADIGPVFDAVDLPSFVDATGALLRQSVATNFPVRVKGLAAEIIDKQPDIVGLQEVALWRTGPPSIDPLLGGPKTATTVRYDFLQLLLDELNSDDERYQAVVIQEEFDFEAPADENGVSGDGPDLIPDAELNARLTLRDVILQRVDAGVSVSDAQGGNFQHLLNLSILGNPVTITRGWTAVDVRVRGALPFHFVNTELESFDPRSVHPSLRAQQAGELVSDDGPAISTLPVVLLGDLNSDDDTVVPDDTQAYRVVLDAGFVERSTEVQLSCCIDSYDLTTGTAAEFDHQVDHIMTNAPYTVKLVESSVTGLTLQNGYWDSEHAGVFSALHIH